MKCSMEDWSLENVSEKYNLIYEGYVFYNDFVKFEGKIVVIMIWCFFIIVVLVEI